MNNQAEFMETLRAVAEIVRTTPEPMTKEEISSYFKDMELTDAQQELVYEYLMHPQEEPAEEEEANAEAKEEKEEVNTEVREEKKETAAEETSSEDEEEVQRDFFQMYLDDLEEIEELDEEEEILLYEKLAAGDESVIAPLAENWLIRVLEIAKEQVVVEEYLEDVIQEGNMSVLLTLADLCGKGKQKDYEEIIGNAVLEAMNNYLVEELSDEMAMKQK